MIHRGKRVGVCHGCCDWGSRGLRRRAIARAGEAVWGCQSDAAPLGAGGDLRRRVSNRGGQARRGRAANGAGLGAGFQRRGAAWPGERQGAGQRAAAHPGAPAGAAGDRRERPDPGGSRRGALAADRPGAMGVRGIPHLDQQADAEPRIARPGLAQAVGPAAPSCPGRRSPGGV